VDGQSLSITNVGKVRNKLEAINNFATSTTTLDPEAKNTAKAPLQVFLGRLVVRVALETRVRNPTDVWALLEVLC
jgi:hypothetical protein